MATIKKYNGSTWENAVVRKYGTASEIITPPTTIYTNGQPISTYSIKGNTVQNGTPTPSSPISVNGVGNKTANLLNTNQSAWEQGGIASSDGQDTESTIRLRTKDYYAIENLKYYHISITDTNFCCNNMLIYNAQKQYIGNYVSSVNPDFNGATSMTLYIPNNNLPNAAFFRLVLRRADNGTITAQDITDIKPMFNLSGNELPFEPYGYKIPISSGGVTTPMYLTEPLMKKGTVVDDLSSSGTVTYNIKKMVLNGSEDWQIEMTDNFYISTPFSGNTGRATVLCTHQVSTSSSYVTGENCFISPSGRFNFTTSAITHTVNDFKTWVQQQYAASTPVTVWYVMETPTTESVTAPPIPTTEGANTITVDTTVQPSEFTATWTGWHNAYVKEKSANLWNEDYTGISGTMKYNAIYVGEGEFTLSSNIVNNNYSYIFFLAGRVASGASTGTNDVYNGQSRTVTAVNGYVTIAFRSTASYSPESYNTMLNSGSTAQTYEPYWK